MGQPLMKGPGPFVKLSRIFRRTFADFRCKFQQNLADEDNYIPRSLNNHFLMDVWLNNPPIKSFHGGFGRCSIGLFWSICLYWALLDALLKQTEVEPVAMKS